MHRPAGLFIDTPQISDRIIIVNLAFGFKLIFAQNILFKKTTVLAECTFF